MFIPVDGLILYDFVPNSHWSIEKGVILNFEPPISQHMQMVHQTDSSYFSPENMIDGTNEDFRISPEKAV
jgi:hypothetical protein